MRYAIYFTPPRDSLLTRLAASWLGRDPFTGSSVPSPSVTGFTPAEIAFHTAAARRYGFHATLKAPFQLAVGETEARLAQAVADFAAESEPFVDTTPCSRPDRSVLCAAAGIARCRTQRPRGQCGEGVRPFPLAAH